LFGPVAAGPAAGPLAVARQAGACLSFGPGGDLRPRPGDTWESAWDRLPPGWRPDFVALDLDGGPAPGWLWRAPVPLVALAADWHLRWHWARRALRHCELALTDPLGVDV